jgi:ABC-2 type transport system permease protein
VVEEKSSRVIEILLATIRPRDLLAGKVLGLGLLGLGQLLIISLFGLVIAAATGSLDVDGDLVVAVALSLGWFILGYAFYASAYAAAGAMVPRQEEIQSSTTPLTMLILISLFIGFGVQDDPDGTLAHVTAFIPPIAPVTMPARIILGAAPAWEIAASAALMVASTAALIPFAGRIYAAVVLRTGSAVKLREALRLARAG